jgi:rubrerythrin
VSAGPRSLQDFMAQALLMEREAVARYTEFADAMDVHNNKEVAALFRTMAGYEGKHAAEIMAQMGWTDATVPPAGAVGWPGFEAPETVPVEDVHYLMQPWHALHLALAAEQRAETFFGQLAEAATDEGVRRAALELQREEQEHVELVRAWIKKVPEPDGDWADDPDPPSYTD